MCVAKSESHLRGPYFFDTSVNNAAYLKMLQTWFVPHLRERDLEATVMLQQDGGSALYAVRLCLDDRVGGRWIDCTLI
jgi:hypothetical protein